MPDYQNGKIYKIVCNITGDIYIGSTTQKYLASRLAGHVRHFKNNLYVTSSKIIKNGSYDIVLLESYPCNNKMELHAKERYYIENNVCVNKVIPNRNQKEYYIDNKKQFLEYYNENKEKINEYKKTYYIDNKEKIVEYRKTYDINNKEKIDEQRKTYYENNKEKFKKKNKEKLLEQK